MHRGSSNLCLGPYYDVVLSVLLQVSEWLMVLLLLLLPQLPAAAE
jgi:hypothetical protein